MYGYVLFCTYYVWLCVEKSIPQLEGHGKGTLTNVKNVESKIENPSKTNMIQARLKSWRIEVYKLYIQLHSHMSQNIYIYIYVYITHICVCYMCMFYDCKLLIGFSNSQNLSLSLSLSQLEACNHKTNTHKICIDIMMRKSMNTTFVIQLWYD